MPLTVHDLSENHIRSVFRKHFKKIGDLLDEPKFTEFINRQLSLCDHVPVAARVSCTIKTHKPVVSVVPRIIHASPGHPLGCFSRFLCMHIKSGLQDCKHIYGSTDDILQGIRKIRFGSG